MVTNSDIKNNGRLLNLLDGVVWRRSHQDWLLRHAAKAGHLVGVSISHLTSELLFVLKQMLPQYLNDLN